MAFTFVYDRMGVTQHVARVTLQSETRAGDVWVVLLFRPREGCKVLW